MPFRRKTKLILRGAACVGGVAVAAIATTGCGKGGALRPTAPTGAEAAGETMCHVVEEHGAPLVVDWTPAERANLETAMASRIAVVHYDCKTIRLLPNCTLEGSYGFMPVSAQEQVIRLLDADEASANLPLHGARLGASLARGTTLDIAIEMIGKKTTTRVEVTPDLLKGDCADATHFVHGAFVGAFAMTTGAAAKATTAASIFEAGVGASTSSGKTVATRAGRIEACREAHVDSPKAPDQCGAVLKLELTAIGAKPVDPKEGAAKEMACPAGLVFANGKCTEAKKVAAHQCKPGDLADCTAQCSASHAGSCTAEAEIYFGGAAGVPKDGLRAMDLWTRACDLGDPQGCFRRGWAYLYAQGGFPLDQAKGMAAEQRACDLGHAFGCYYAGLGYERAAGGLPQDDAKAVSLFKRACDGGQPWGCFGLAGQFVNGRGGLAVDRAQAASLYAKSCDGGIGDACGWLGDRYRDGDGVYAKDLVKALAFYQRGCNGSRDQTSHLGCVNLGNAYRDGWGGVAVDGNRALEAYAKGCELSNGDGCWAAGDLFLRGQAGMPKDLARSFGWYEKGCALKNGYACEQVGWGRKDGWGGQPVDGAKALEAFAKACDLGRGTACTMAGFVLANPPAGLAQDFAKSVEYSKRGCDVKEGGACANLADLYAEGKGLPLDVARAEALYRQACDELKAVRACFVAGWRYENGPNGFAKDAARALAAYKKGCTLGAKEACDAVARLEKKKP